jgi:hypothetical protein
MKRCRRTWEGIAKYVLRLCMLTNVNYVFVLIPIMQKLYSTAGWQRSVEDID